MESHVAIARPILGSSCPLVFTLCRPTTRDLPTARALGWHCRVTLGLPWLTTVRQEGSDALVGMQGRFGGSGTSRGAGRRLVIGLPMRPRLIVLPPKNLGYPRSAVRHRAVRSTRRLSAATLIAHQAVAGFSDARQPTQCRAVMPRPVPVGLPSA